MRDQALLPALAVRAPSLVVALVLGLGGSAGAQETKLDTLKTAVTAAPADAEASLSLGRALRRAGHLPEARTELRRARTLSGKQELLRRVYWELERVEADRRDYVQATAVCRGLAAIPGSATEGHACLAAAELVRQRATEALTETALALGADPRSFEAKFAEGRAYALQLDGTKAEASLRAAIALRPVAVEPFVELGKLLDRGGRHDEGITQLRAALQLDPSDPDALYALATLLPAGPESLGLLQRAVAERPSMLDAWLALGSQQLAAGHVSEAGTAAASALRADGSSTVARILMGKVALQEGRASEAIEAGRGVLKTMANSAAATLLVADGEAKNGELDRALEAYQAAWGLDHGDPTPLVHASQACHAAGRDTSARAFGVKATQEFPKWGPAWAALGDALASQGEAAAARDAYRKALAGDGVADAASIASKLAALR
jgi:tetratricopeptide (TPR) repeat protein